MLSISGMLGPSSPAPQRPSWYENESERLSQPEERHLGETPELPLDEDLQTFPNTATSAEPSSPEEPFRAGSHTSSLNEVAWAAAPFNQNQPIQDRKRKVNNVEHDRDTLPDQGRFAETTSLISKKKRAPRPQYTKEQEDFIWFCRDDLSMSWRKVVELYNNYWHPLEVEPHIRSESGLQSRYYRILDFPVKIRKKKEPSRPDLGLIPSTHRRYPWMGVIKADLQERGSVGINARCNTTAERDVWTSREGIREEKGVEDGTSDKIETIGTGSESTDNNREKPEMRRSKKWSSPKPTELCSEAISHTLETDSEAGHDREWEISRPSISTYERYNSKPVPVNEDPRILVGEGPICLPPLRRYLYHITNDRRRRARERPRPNYSCKIPVTNLCV